MINEHEISLGSKVKDNITSFTGIVTAVSYYINGCVQYLVRPTKLDEGKIMEAEWIDIQRLKVTRRATVKTETKLVGSESRHAPTSSVG